MEREKLLIELEQRFGAVQKEPYEEQLQYLEERDLLYQECGWNFNAFVRHYQLIKRYALIEKCLVSLAWKIKHVLDASDIQEFQHAEFHKLFGDIEIIKSALEERGIE